MDPTVPDSPIPLAPSGLCGCRASRCRPSRTTATRRRWASRSRPGWPSGGCPPRRRPPPPTAPGRCPWAIPPCCWPSTRSGLRTRPQSSTATWRTRPDQAGVGIDLHHGHVGAERERRPRLGEVPLRHQRRALPLPGDGQVGPRQGPGRYPGDAEAPVLGEDDVALGGLEELGGEGPAGGQHGVGGARHRACRPVAASGTRRCRPRWGRRRCRTARTGSRSSGRPRRSATSMAKAVAWPWPWADVPALTVTVPSPWTSTAPHSVPLPPAVIST